MSEITFNPDDLETIARIAKKLNDLIGPDENGYLTGTVHVKASGGGYCIG